jgi:hypothetical protein
MKLIPRRLLGAAAAVATGATALLGTGAGTAEAVGRVHCDRIEQAMWSEGPSRNVTGHGCSLPDEKRRWYRIETDTLVRTDYKTDYLNGGINGTRTLHDRTFSCMGYTTDKDTVYWFGCPPA